MRCLLKDASEVDTGGSGKAANLVAKTSPLSISFTAILFSSELTITTAVLPCTTIDTSLGSTLSGKDSRTMPNREDTGGSPLKSIETEVTVCIVSSSFGTYRRSTGLSISALTSTPVCSFTFCSIISDKLSIAIVVFDALGTLAPIIRPVASWSSVTLSTGMLYASATVALAAFSTTIVGTSPVSFIFIGIVDTVSSDSSFTVAFKMSTPLASRIVLMALGTLSVRILMVTSFGLVSPRVISISLNLRSLFSCNMCLTNSRWDISPTSTVNSTSRVGSVCSIVLLCITDSIGVTTKSVSVGATIARAFLTAAS